MHRLKYEREKEKLRKCFSTGAKKNEKKSSIYIYIYIYIRSETLFKCLSWAMWNLKPFIFLFFFLSFFSNFHPDSLLTTIQSFNSTQPFLIICYARNLAQCFQDQLALSPGAIPYSLLLVHTLPLRHSKGIENYLG